MRTGYSALLGDVQFWQRKNQTHGQKLDPKLSKIPSQFINPNQELLFNLIQF